MRGVGNSDGLITCKLRQRLDGDHEVRVGDASGQWSGLLGDKAKHFRCQTARSSWIEPAWSPSCFGPSPVAARGTGCSVLTIVASSSRPAP
jgi:hypothetical protein